MVLNDIDIDGTKNLRHTFVGRKFVDDHCTYCLPHDEHYETHQPKLGNVIATVKEPRNLPLEVEYTIVRSRFNQKAVCESFNENDRGEGE